MVADNQRGERLLRGLKRKWLLGHLKSRLLLFETEKLQVVLYSYETLGMKGMNRRPHCFSINQKIEGSLACQA